jgi:hypothetical protein
VRFVAFGNTYGEASGERTVFSNRLTMGASFGIDAGCRIGSPPDVFFRRNLINASGWLPVGCAG